MKERLLEVSIATFYHPKWSFVIHELAFYKNPAIIMNYGLLNDIIKQSIVLVYTF